MKTTKISQRVNWINEHRAEIETAIATPADHSQCKGDCHNGATCKAQSGGGYGYWAKAFAGAGINPNTRPYWSGSNPTPSTSIDSRLSAILHQYREELKDKGIA